MKTLLLITLALAAALHPLPAQDRAANLEARLKESAEGSAEAARMMLELIELYEKEEQIFGLIRTAGKFARAQTDHLKRPEVMLKLIEGYAITGRHDDVLSTGRQFTEKFPSHPLALDAREHLATSLERTSRFIQAAKVLDANWKQGSRTNDGVRSLKLYQKAANAESFRLSTALAKSAVEKMPADTILAGVGMVGLEMANRAELWADGLQIAKTVLRRKAPLTDAQTRKLWDYTGTFESRLGQHANALASYQKAMSKSDHDIHRKLIGAMQLAKKPASQIEAAVRQYISAYPNRDDHSALLVQVANAYAASQQLGNALKIGLEVMSRHGNAHDIARSYVTWCGENHAQAERGLLQAIQAKPNQTGALRAILALEVYNDRMKKTAKARAMAQDYLSKSPTEDGWAERIVGLLLESSPSDSAFQKDLNLVSKSATAHLHLPGYQAQVWKYNSQDKKKNSAFQNARKSFSNSANARTWKQVWESGGKSGQACRQLLQQKQTPEVRQLLMSRLAYVYRHHLGGNSLKKAAEHYQALCKAYPKDYQAAQMWLEAADYSDQAKEMQLAAARHVLSFSPRPTHYDTWLRLISTRNPDLIRKALPWITSTTAKSGASLYHNTRLGDILWELEMKKEAVSWWRSRMDIDPNHQECVSCAQRVANTLADEQARELLQKRFLAETDFQSSYAGNLAALAFKADNLNELESIIKESKSRAAKRPFHPTSFAYWPSRSWLDAARGSKEWTAAKKARVFGIVAGLETSSVSTEASLDLLASRPKGIERLRAAHRAILFSDQHHQSWTRVYPYAQGAVARGDFQLGVTVLNGLIHIIRGVGDKELNDARTLLRKAYGKMGTLSADIPEDSPIAPLLQVILHLRLGEDEMAEAAYYKNRQLFDDNRADLPIELILFGAQIHINQGTEEDHQRAEDILRGWMIKNSESEKIEIRDKARVQLLLARNYQRSQQYDIARAEFTTVLNLYKDQPEAVEARFGIGETFMAQKVYDQAEEIFAELSASPIPQITIRAEFLRGVLEIRQGNNDSARRIFLAVLESAPDAKLANETLFNLAEVYGLEQRYLTQLETLRTVGRLGRESKLWHTPGKALSVVVQDIDLGISRGETRIPVIVRTDPGGDEERSYLVSGGAGKGIFLTEFATELGIAQVDSGTIEVTGGDVITVDYPVDFKKEFQFEFLSETRLRVASDGSLKTASSQILNQDDESFTDALKKEAAEPEEKQGKAHERPKNQIKPGNLIYTQVKDGDRDLTKNPDGVPVIIKASSGDQVRTVIMEESQHGGVFSGTIRSGELPAGAQASDSAIDHSPLMAIDHSKETSWRSQPDGAAPKSLSIDLKELREVDSITFSSPDPEQEAPVRMHLRGSHDGRFWYTLARFPAPAPDPPISFGKDGSMTLRVYEIEKNQLRASYTWKDLVTLVEKGKPVSEEVVETLSWTPPQESTKAYFLVWSGKFFQEREGGMRFSIAGQHSGLMVDGRLELGMGEGGREADIYAKAGVHAMTAVSIISTGGTAGSVQRARENAQSASVSLRNFRAADFDLGRAADFPKVEGPLEGSIVQEKNEWRLTLPTHILRFLECQILEYRGEAVAINHVEVKGGESVHVPPKEDVMLLAKNDILELAPGDSVEVSYIDEITAGGAQRNKLLTASLTATYFNGKITPISYDFARDGGGSVGGNRKELLRIEPGERIVAEVVDYDLDISNEMDTVEVQVQVNAGSLKNLTATETGPSTGIFLIEIDTAAQPDEEGKKLVVKRGDKVYIRYRDEQNTFPGHAFYRESVVLLNEPTDAVIQIVESVKQVGGSLAFLPMEENRAADHVSKVDYHLPLTVEVIDPDQAKDSRSTITVEVATSGGSKVLVECVLSRNFAPPSEQEEEESSALYEGRFVGQVPLLLGDVNSANSVPAGGSIVKPGIGRVIPPPTSEEDLLDDGKEKESGLLVLNMSGKDKFTASYRDERRPAGDAVSHQAMAELATGAIMRLTDEEYQEDAVIANVGKKIYLWLKDPDLDISPDRDKAMVQLRTESGEDEMLILEETLSHSGVFSASFPLKAAEKPVKGNSTGSVECFFGDSLTVGYVDNVVQTEDGEFFFSLALPIAVGTDGLMSAFSKIYKDEGIAIQTQFHIAESYFELFKSHLKLEREEEAKAALAAGRRVLREVQEDYPSPKHAPRIAYLLGQFSQELNEWDEAIVSYKSIVRNYPEHELAPDAQYKLGQCYEKAEQLDEALESYVTLAATYPKSPLIANVMLRINEHFYNKEEYLVAASVGSKFLERFPNHEWTPRMGFRIGQCYFKEEDFKKAGLAFDNFVKRFPEEELTAQALFWGGESYRMSRDVPNAFRRYNRCRWDFPESDAAKYSRGRLALPEMLAQFEREANLSDE